jgi:hypothetical protein
MEGGAGTCAAFLFCVPASIQSLLAFINQSLTMPSALISGSATQLADL